LEIAANDYLQNKETFEKARDDQFGLIAINNVEEIEKRIKELKATFYNRLESKKLIKKYGRIPFTEHMTISKQQYISV
jgi:hypothetical protein